MRNPKLCKLKGVAIHVDQGWKFGDIPARGGGSQAGKTCQLEYFGKPVKEIFSFVVDVVVHLDVPHPVDQYKKGKIGKHVFETVELVSFRKSRDDCNDNDICK